MEITCPHCAHVHEDELEVLGTADSGPMKCEGCGVQFALTIWECDVCGECVGSTSPLEVAEDYNCPACGAGWRCQTAGAAKDELDAADTGN